MEAILETASTAYLCLSWGNHNSMHVCQQVSAALFPDQTFCQVH